MRPGVRTAVTAVLATVSAGCSSTWHTNVSALQWANATFSGVTFRYPVGWHAVEPTFNTAAVFAPIGWVTNEKVRPQCTPDADTGHVGCHAPVDRLTDVGVLVSLTESGGAPVSDFHPNTTFAGLPAHQSHVSGVECISGATSGILLVVDESERFLRLTACFGRHAEPAETSVHEMLASATYRAP
jgi:hypothetical protein